MTEVRIRPTMWLRECGCLVMIEPDRFYPCAKHREPQRDWGILAAFVSSLVIWAGFICVVMSWAR